MQVECSRRPIHTGRTVVYYHGTCGSPLRRSPSTKISQHVAIYGAQPELTYWHLTLPSSLRKREKNYVFPVKPVTTHDSLSRKQKGAVRARKSELDLSAALYTYLALLEQAHSTPAWPALLTHLD